jgi:S1-C subfamily serine protease
MEVDMNGTRLIFGQHRLMASCIACVAAMATAAASSADTRDAAKRAVAATVAVEWKGDAEASADRNEPRSAYSRRVAQASQSSGTVVSPDGLVVSFAGDGVASAINVTFADGRSLPARRLVVDRRNQLALLKVDAADLAGVTLAQQPPEVGETVVAAMCADAESRIVGKGIVAATDRQVSGLVGKLIQTDIEATRMSAGSPLVNEEGELVGIIIAAAREANEQGPAFAVPTSVVRELVELRTRARGEEAAEVVVKRGFLGLSFGAMSEPPVVQTVLPEAPAAHVDIEEGDTIVTVDGQPVQTTLELTEAIAAKPAGELVVLELKRRDQPVEVRVKLAERPELQVPDAKLDYNVDAIQSARLYVLGQDGKPLAVDPKQVVEKGQVLGQIAESVKDPTTAKNLGEVYSNWYRTLNQSAAQAEAPVLRVERSDLDKKLTDLTSEVESLRKQVEALTEAVTKLGVQLGEEE